MENEWDWISHDGLIKKKIISSGNSRLHPFDGSRCRVKYLELLVDDEKLLKGCPPVGDEQEFILGENDTLFQRVIVRLIQTMVSKEIALAEVKVNNFIFTVKLELIECKIPLKPIHRMTHEEKIAEAKKLKERASELIKDNRYEDAISLLKRGFKCVIWADEMEDTNKSELYCSVVANMSLCYLKLRNHEITIKLCTCVLTKNPNHAKCLMRRATAYDFIEETEKAKKDILSVLEVEPHNKAAENLLNKINVHISKQKDDYTKLVRKMLQVDKK